jgi:two-component system chemotaxis response regulator CheY
MRTLVVEPSPVNRAFLLGVMEDQGPCVAAATAGDGLRLFLEALERGEPFDVVFLDVQLPDMNGLQVLETMRAEESRREVPPLRAVKALITSASSDEHAAARAFFQGQAISYLTRPLTVGKIFNELERFGLAAARSW